MQAFTTVRLWAVASLVCLAAALAPAAGARADTVALVQDHLYAGTLKAGEAALADAVAHDTADANARFGLGLIQFTRAVEHLSQSLYRYGLQPPAQLGIPIVRMPVPVNADPEALSYQAFRGVLQDFVDDLQKADDTLAGIGDAAVRLPVDPTRIRIDITGDGAVRDDERLWVIFSGVAHASAADDAGDMVAVLDAADVHWLRGYSHLMMAFTEVWLAHDFKTTFDETFGLFFPRAGLTESFSRSDDRGRSDLSGIPGADIAIADVISLVHLIHWQVAEPPRMLRAREHLLQVVGESRADWRRILQRHDDERRWIPGPGQKGILRGLDVTPEQVSAWMGVLDNAEAILEGHRLVPHWRFTKGINIKKVFTQPEPFDLVLWITGPAARPFLAAGDTIPSQAWDQMISAFEGNFLTYAFWFN